MNTPKSRVSPSSTPRHVRQRRTSVLDSDSVPSPVSKDKSPAVGRSPMKSKISDSDSVSSHVSKDKNPAVGRSPMKSKISELELQITQLNEELKKANARAEASESNRRRAELEAEESNKKVHELSEKLEEANKQEEARLQELGKISQDRDRAWQSEVEAVQEQHSIKSAALSSAMNEIHKLKMQLEVTMHSCRRSEALAMEVSERSRNELQAAKAAEDALRTDYLKCTEACKSMAALVETLEEQARVLKRSDGGELEKMAGEVNRLNSALDAVEIERHEEDIQNTVRWWRALEVIEGREAVLRELTRGKVEAEEETIEGRGAALRELTREKVEAEEETDLQSMKEEKETDLQGMKEEKETELQRMKEEKETELQRMKEENETMKLEIGRRLRENKSAAAALAVAEEEVGRSNRQAARAVEQMDAVQAANSELDAELRRLKVQLDQWRKAAEAATAMLSTGDGKQVDRSGSLDNNNSFHGVGHQLGSLFAEEIEDDDSITRKNGNVLRKFGVLWRKSQSQK